MPETEFNVTQVDWELYRPQLQEIRRRVFILEQHIPQALEQDNKDEAARHVLAVDTAGNGIGTGRVSTQGQIGRMAVYRTWRNRGVGSALLKQLVQVAREANLPPLYLNAQQDAIRFYQRHGFVAVGEPFLEAGITHQRMQQKPEPPGTGTPI